MVGATIAYPRLMSTIFVSVTGHREPELFTTDLILPYENMVKIIIVS